MKTLWQLTLTFGEMYGIFQIEKRGLSMILDKEINTYHRELDNLLVNEGKFVLIQDDKVEGVFDTYEDALKVGYERFKLTPFLVKKIQAVEQVLFFTRDIISCPT